MSKTRILRDQIHGDIEASGIRNCFYIMCNFNISLRLCYFTLDISSFLWYNIVRGDRIYHQNNLGLTKEH